MRTIMPGHVSNATEENKVSKPKAGSSKASTSKEDAASKPSGPGSSKGSVPPATPKAKGVVNADAEDVDAEEDLLDEEEDDMDIDEDLAQLEALEAGGGSSTAPKPKKRGRPSKAGNTPTPKKGRAKATSSK